MSKVSLSMSETPISLKEYIQKYGKEVWTPVVIIHKGTEFEKGVYNNYEISNFSRIRNKNSKTLLSVKNDSVSIQYNNVEYKFRKYRLCLASFKPEKIPTDITKYHVDHIDNNHLNNHLENLQWISPSDHARKTSESTLHVRKDNVQSLGKRIIVSKVLNNGDTNLLGKVFNSRKCAATYFGYKKSSSISSKITSKNLVKKKYLLEDVKEGEIEGEIFRDFGEYKISNKGRYLNKYGKICLGSPVKNTRYRKVQLKKIQHLANTRFENKTCFSVHTLVWMVFHNNCMPPKEGYVVMHDDTKNTLDNRGMERNWAEDLKLGTQKENICSFYKNTNKNIKSVICTSDKKKFRSISEAARYYNTHRSNICKVVRGKRKTWNGKKFIYV